MAKINNCNLKEADPVYIPTEDKLFDHGCQFKDMKLSAFNPKSLTYYCQICGGKFIIEKDMKDWAELFGEPINLRLTKKVLQTILDERELEAQKEEEESARKEEQARLRAEEARKKFEQVRRQEEEEKIKIAEKLKLETDNDKEMELTASGSEKNGKDENKKKKK